MGMEANDGLSLLFGLFLTPNFGLTEMMMNWQSPYPKIRTRFPSSKDTTFLTSLVFPSPPFSNPQPLTPSPYL